jgi:hypothetical protein
MHGRDECLVDRPERKKLLGTPRHRWEDNVELDFKEAGYGNVY